MLKNIGIALAAALLMFAGVADLQPDQFRVERSAAINAPASRIFSQVNNLHGWDAWSPWAKIDPDAKVTFEGPLSGIGAKMSWDGNRDVGQGSMKITESKPASRIVLQLDFIRPMEGTNTVEFTFKPEGNHTLVSWSMSGKSNFIGKAVGLIFNCQKMIGEQYEKGLANLKAVSEKR